MSEPTFPDPSVPATPPKKKTGKVLLIVGIIVVVLCLGGLGVGWLLLNKAVDVAYAEGKCVDSMSTSATATTTVVPNAVECSDPKAVGKILKVADGKGAADAEAVCGNVPGVSSFTVLLIKGGDTKLLCLGAK
ncbi:hypothetical protein GCM10009682_44440 [Luedemannella flava]|uniref:Uncharacterized protein n=1 Tax=Luedemannella flava TaxID=349316 RepID=A0ABP4YIM2_9ACTN